MNFNDPFGRVQRKQQRNYESLRLSLQKCNVTNRDDAQALVEKIRWRGIWGLAVIVPLFLVLALVLPQLRFLVLACGVLFVYWWRKTSTKSQEYIKRYIREELVDDEESTPC